MYVSLTSPEKQKSASIPPGQDCYDCKNTKTGMDKLGTLKLGVRNHLEYKFHNAC